MDKSNVFFAANPAESFYQKETFCEHLFQQSGPFWHLCTPGTNQEIIFSAKEDMISGLNILAICAVEHDISIYALCLMNNHIHIIISCDEAVGHEFFLCFKKRLSRFLSDMEKDVNLSNFRLDKLIPINSLEELRNEIVYVNRNGYVANHNHNPFSYPWGTSCLYFNRLCSMWKGTPFSDLTYRDRQKIMHSRVNKTEYKFLVQGGLILPSSYCLVNKGEQFFRDNWHYFSMLTKNYEAYGLVARKYSESNFLTDEEIYPAVKQLCQTQFNVRQPKQLSDSQKREMIIYMHNHLKSTNDQIRRILSVDINMVNELFPLSVR